jgi:hypothetical protein
VETPAPVKTKAVVIALGLWLAAATTAIAWGALARVPPPLVLLGATAVVCSAADHRFPRPHLYTARCATLAVCRVQPIAGDAVVRRMRLM